jgi:hypothetical protein
VPAIAPFINANNARELAKLSLAKRLENAAKYKESLAIANDVQAIAGAQADSSTLFTMAVLNRVRKQIETILASLEELPKPDEVDKLCRSLDKLMEQERKLSGRPLPGSLRPSSKPAKQSRSSDPVPEPEFPSPSGPVEEPL